MNYENNQESNVWVVDEILPHRDRLKSWLQRRFPALDDVDDIVQESIFRVLKAHHSGPIINPKAYLFLTAKNIVYNRFRHLKLAKVVGDESFSVEEIHDDLDDPLEVTSKNEEIKALLDAIKLLPRRCRQVITLRKIYGYSLKETAEILGVSVSTVDAQSCIALRKCTEHFRKNGFWEKNS